VTPDPTRVAALRDGPVAVAIRARRLVVVLRRVEPRERLVALVEGLVEAGARVFEVTFDAPEAAGDLEAVRAVASGAAGSAGLVGAGTVTDVARLEAARKAGAAFAVAPTFDPALMTAALAAELPFVPGAFSPTEIAAAWAGGATFVKLFPGSAVGPGFVRELRGPLPEVELIVTGGIDATNAIAFLEAGAAAIGIGGALVRASATERRALVAAVTGATPGRSEG